MSEPKAYYCIRVLEDGEREVPTHVLSVAKCDYDALKAENERLRRAFVDYDAFLWWLVCGSEEGPRTVDQVNRCASALMDKFKELREATRDTAYTPYSPSNSPEG